MVETTLEVRWFFPGIVPSSARFWFEGECPGKPLADREMRTDRYFLVEDLGWVKKFFSSNLERAGVNLKLRQGNLELKLREQSSICRFQPSNQSSLFNGRVERWCKFDREELPKFIPDSLVHSDSWLDVKKVRSQKIERGVAIELTALEIDGEFWWTIALEMPYNPNESHASFIEVVERACQSYRSSELSIANSFGYSCWLDRFS